MKKETSNNPRNEAMPHDNKLTPAKFLVRQMNGIMRGELTLDEETSELYRNAPPAEQTNIRSNLRIKASEHFKTDCYVSEILNCA